MFGVRLHTISKSRNIFENGVFWWLIFSLGFGAFAARLENDGTPDFKIYHFYNGFAAHHSRAALDIAPAQLQTYFFFKVDAVYYSLITVLNDHPVVLNILLSLPYSFAAFYVFLIARWLLDESFPFCNIASAVVAIVGLTGAAALPTLATTMSDIVPGVPLLFAIMLWVAFEKTNRNTVWTELGIGFIAGLSVGLKLTQAPLFAGLFLAIAARRLVGRKSALKEAIIFGAAGIAAFFIVDFSWLWGNYTLYGNPIFPLMNNVFKSPLVAALPWTDLRFMPKTTLMALFYPAYWAFQESQDTIELKMHDPRILFGCAGAILILILFVPERFRKTEKLPVQEKVEALSFCLAIAYLSSYILWEKTWSIYRYLALQECLSGVMVLAALNMLARERFKQQWVLGLCVIISVFTLGTTKYPWWSRAKRGPQAITVNLPPIEANAMVLFLDAYAYSYLIPFMPDTARAIGVNTNISGPGSTSQLQVKIEEAIRDHPGPFWGMEYPKAFPGAADFSLKSYGLARTDDCVRLDTNIDDAEYVKICKLQLSQSQ